MGLALEPNIGACDTSQGFVFFRPGGPIENSPRLEPWGRGHPPHAQPRQGRQRLLPDIPLLVRDPLRLQEGEEFLLKGYGKPHPYEVRGTTVPGTFVPTVRHLRSIVNGPAPDMIDGHRERPSRQRGE